MKWFLNLKIRSKILTAFLGIVILMGIVGSVGIFNLQKISKLDSDLYEDNTKAISFASTIQVNLQKNKVLCRTLLIETDTYKNNESKNIISKNDEEIDKAMEELKLTLKDQELVNEYNNLKVNMDKYRPLRDKFIDLALQNKDTEAVGIMNGDAGIFSSNIDNSATKLIELKEAEGKVKADTNSKAASSAIIIMLVVISMGIVIALVFGIIISGLISRPINKVLTILGEMSKGHLGERVDISTNDEIGQMAKVMDSFSNTLQNDVIGAMNKIAKGNMDINIVAKDEKDEIAPALNKVVENVRMLVTDVNMLSNSAIEGKFETRADAGKHEGDFRKVIDGVNGTLDTVVDKAVWYEAIIDAIPFPIHVTDNDMNWTYMNKSFENLMINQGVIRDRKSGYGLACSHAGANICNTEKCGIKQLHKGKSESFFEWCGMSNKQDTSYLKNKNGENVGYVEVVTDLTPIIRVSDYTKGEVKRLEGNLKLLACGNTNFDLKIKEADQFTDEVSRQFEGISNSLKDVKRAIDNLIFDAKMLSNAAIEGKLDIRADETKHSGDFKQVVEGVNQLIGAMVEPIKEVTSVMSEISKGNLDVLVSENYKGEFGILAKAVNETEDGLKRVVGEISDIIGQISQGNLNIENVKEFHGNFNNISVSLNTIIDSLNSVLSEINNVSEQVYTGASQVSDGSQLLSQGATEQASAIEQLTSSITEIAAQTKENAFNANQAKELALEVKVNAEQGSRHMNEMLKSMGEINESSANISKIIKVIDEIAFQTNILALNAAVEAARAGQHGKGFAVVAEEVRNLAARSANAAKETTALIEGSIKKSENGTEIANNTAKALYEIVDGVSKAATLVSEIAASSDEQATGISQVNLGIEQVSQVVQTNSATAEESAAASEELSSQSELLKDLVSSFKLKNDSLRGRVSKNSKNYILKQSYDMGDNSLDKEVAVTSNKKRIKLSDSEFGKY
ncbi:methyl-accepting chemotaxis protein [Clostridium sp. YIM B02569]|uniref:methyl-accepting chemotaxis protein n=1 Tax=Clostridium sp. YIM B02569 TaxID=2911967 RepID=UPI001EECC3A0|nr:methyl-accepting chemotaxis protein [Clostridium sp. YIM B02569]